MFFLSSGDLTDCWMVCRSCSIDWLWPEKRRLAMRTRARSEMKIAAARVRIREKS
jgi:hypothetical protein